MKRYFLFFSYSGSNYNGWQIQPNASSVQAEIEQALSMLFKEKLSVVGAGRTDTGVHAKMMVAHFDIHSTIDTDLTVYKLNCILPTDIAVFKLVQVSSDFHARFDALSRTYEYKVFIGKNPFYENWAYRLVRTPDFDLMNRAAESLIGKKDFSCFSKSHTQTFTNDCDLMEAKWYKREELWIFEIKANRFLRNMVRAIVGTLLEVGEGKRSVETVNDLLTSKNRSNAGKSVPAKGLYLTSIEYPKEGFIG